MDAKWRAFFEPRHVAVIGASATPGKPGHEVIRNIQANGYGGELYLVNPKGGQILGLPVYDAIGKLPPDIDQAIIILPAKDTLQAMQDCADQGIRHLVLAAGGFAEVDAEGARIQEAMSALVRERGLHVLGPNTSGHTSTPQGFTSSFFPLGKIRRGRVSYIAQTGNFATHTMKYILSAEHFGVSRVIGLGNKIDIDETEALACLAQDEETSAIILYLESIKRPRQFLEVAREATRRKPVLALKSGATEEGRAAAVAHTAAMAAEDRLIDGLFRQAGIVRIQDYTQLILTGKALSMVQLPRGNRVGFLAPSGAMLVVLSDLCSRLGLQIPMLTPESLQRLRDMSPAFIRMRNPVDIWAAASTRGVENGYREGLEILLEDPNIDAVVVVLLLTEKTGLPGYDFIVEAAGRYPQKPVLVTFSAEKLYMDSYKEALESRNVPTFPEIEQPFETLATLWRCHRAMNRQGD